jgi:hypothetical protein
MVAGSEKMPLKLCWVFHNSWANHRIVVRKTIVGQSLPALLSDILSAECGPDTRVRERSEAPPGFSPCPKRAWMARITLRHME